MAKAIRWTYLQELSFDDFFGKKLSYEGFKIERVVGGYHVSSNPADAQLPATDASPYAEPETKVREPR